MRTLFRKYQAYFLQNNKQLLLKTTNRIFSAMSAIIAGYCINWVITIYAYILTSIVLDVIFYKLLKLRESFYKNPEFFSERDMTGEEYDRFKISLLNARIIVFIIAHSLILFDMNIPWINYLPFISIVCIFAMFFATIYVGHRYGYLEFRPGEGKFEEFYTAERKTGYGLPGYVAGVYTGDPHDIGS